MKPSILDKYKVEIDAYLVRHSLPTHTMVGVIFVDEARLAELGEDVVLLSAEDREQARENWKRDRPSDPYGWGPTETRVIAIICALC